MDKKIKTSLIISSIVIILFFVVFFLFVENKEHASEEIDKNTALEDVERSAEKWIKEHSATYRERGGSGLEITKSEELDEGWYQVSFEFQTEEPGYGRPEDGMDSEEENLNREIVVRAYYNRLESAIVDGVYDDMGLTPVSEMEIPGPGMYEGSDPAESEENAEYPLEEPEENEESVPEELEEEGEAPPGNLFE